MPIATVARVAGATQNEDTYIVSLSPTGHEVLKRWAVDSGRNRANVLEEAIQAIMRNKRNDQRNTDGPTLADKMAAATTDQKAQLNAILNTIIVTPSE